MSSIVYLSDKKGCSQSRKPSRFKNRAKCMLSQGSSQNALCSHGYARHSSIDLFQQIIDVSEYTSVAQVHCVRHGRAQTLEFQCIASLQECYLNCADSPPCVEWSTQLLMKCSLSIY